MKEKNYYLGLDIGTDSVGYAVTDKEYNLLKFRGEPAWGVTIFDEASLNAERRSFRSARRRLDRRQQRVSFIQELFAEEIAKVDVSFFKRLQESYLFRDEAGEPFTLFNDPDFTDRDYHKKYPTIHHLIFDLMTSKQPHDVRLVYLACAWLVSHRGHFLNNIDRNNISSVTDFGGVYQSFMSHFTENGYDVPWGECDINTFSNILRSQHGVTNKYRALSSFLFPDSKPSKNPSEQFPFSCDSILRLLAGGKVALKDLFNNDDYTDLGSISLGIDEEKLNEIVTNLGDDSEIIVLARSIYDWSLLVDALGNSSCISESKINVYEQHKADLKFLKHIVKTYCPQKYDAVFRDLDKDNYVAYTYHTNDGNTASIKKKKTNEDFSKYILGLMENISPTPADKVRFDDMIERLKLGLFMPKQKNTDNRVLPHQLYWYELDCILKNASGYLPFLSSKDEIGKSVKDKIEEVFLFRIPYFVGPLNTHSKYAWIVRKPGSIKPWNFEDLVDIDASEEAFIRKLTNTCSYLPGEPVLPKDSLLYHKFTVLNEINNLRINGNKIPVEVKQQIYNDVFMTKKKISKKYLVDYLIRNGIVEKGFEELVTGVDVNINSNLVPQIAFRNLLDSKQLSEEDVERIIQRSSYAEDKGRLFKWLAREYPKINESDRCYICSIKIKDFGRLSRRFLTEFEGVNKLTGEVTTIMNEMWNTQNNLMEIIGNSDNYTFEKELEKNQIEYYSKNPISLENRLDEMYLSNAVKRPVYRTFAIVKDVVKAFGVPEKIFVEMTRGADESTKGKRTTSRKEQLDELYKNCRDEDVRLLKKQLEEMGDSANNKLQSEKLFLYYLQLGKCMYSGKTIDLSSLATKEYDIDHIYPQSFVKDDSIINNKVLVLSEENGKKGDKYPIRQEVRQSMTQYWSFLKDKGLINDEKFKRLSRATGFTDEEKYAFINRQLTETSQSTKAVATLLKEKYPSTEIVYCKARLVSEFRQEFEVLKSRLYNDLHHAEDAYLNIVTGNVYNMRFSKQWFNIDSSYSVKTKTIFTHPVRCGNELVWDGVGMLSKAKTTVCKNNAHFTKFSFFKKGGLFDQTLYPAASGLTALKKDKPTEKYGGYNKASIMFFIPVTYQIGKKKDTFILSIEQLYGSRFLRDEIFAKEYAKKRLSSILNKNIDSISFPNGLSPWKVNTVLSLNGFHVCIAGSSSGGKCLIAQPITQFSSSQEWKYYLKKLESFVDKTEKNSKYIYSEEYDHISVENNIELYDLYLNKLSNTLYKYRVNNPFNTILAGKDMFTDLPILEQSKELLLIHQIFGRLSSGVDLSLIGGAGKSAATVSFSASVSNWRKSYNSVIKIDSSASGLFTSSSPNLLEIL